MFTLPDFPVRRRRSSSAGSWVAVVILIACLSFAPLCRADELARFRALPDNRIAIRTSLGLREAQATDATHVRPVLGMSVTPAAGRAASYRILSFREDEQGQPLANHDDRYAYEKFVTPLHATAKSELEVAGPAGCPFSRFERTVVMLELPMPLKENVQYHVVAQGSQGEMVTGGHTAGSLVYRAEQGLGKADSAPTSRTAPGDRLTADGAVNLAVLGLRQVESVGRGVLKLEFGPDFSIEAAHRLQNYGIRVNRKTADVVQFGRITRVDTYLPTGWPFVPIPMHEMFLQLDRELEEGDRVEVEVDARVTTAGHSATLVFHASQSLSNSIKVNQVGYLTDSPVKIGYLGRWMGSFPETAAAGGSEKQQDPQTFWKDLVPANHENRESAADNLPHEGPAPTALGFREPPEFDVCREEDDRAAFHGKARFVHRAGEMNEGFYKVDHSGENVYVLDFTGLTTPGRYYLRVPHVGRSLPFAIGDDVYQKAFAIQSYGVFAQRCGMALKPPFSSWRRIACHDQGLVVTTQIKNELHEIQRDLPRKVLFSTGPATVDAAWERLNSDKSLVARYPLDGDFSDVSGHRHDLVPLGTQKLFSPCQEILPKSAHVWGPTAAGNTNGAGTKGMEVDDAAGLTIAGWFKKDENNNFHDVLFGIGRPGWGNPSLLVTASWGVLEFAAGKASPSARHARINDGHWHHLALAVDAANASPRRASLAVDGRPVATCKVTSSIRGEFSLGTITGNGAANAYFADFRLYARPLTTAEISLLATPRPSAAPVKIAAHGGHHDAGDYNPRSHLDVAQTLMDAYEIAPRKFYDGQLNIPERGNGIPDILDEAAWALRLWADLQDEDGGVHNGTESAGDPSFIDTVELDPKGDYAYAKDAAGSFWSAGAFAQAARIWKSLGREKESAEFLQRARHAYAWAEKHPPKVRNAAQYAVQWLNPKSYAAAQLLHTTGENGFNRDFLEACVWSRKRDAEIEVYNRYDQSLAAWGYVNCSPAATDPSIRKSVEQAIIQRADLFIRYCEKMPYGFIRHPWGPINWGTGAYENNLPPVIWAMKLTGDAKYRSWIIRTCDNTLGANPLNRSYIVGLGTRTVRAPLHNSRYCHRGEVVDGQQVQGPVQAGDGYHVADTAYPPLRVDFANLQTFVDCHFAIGMDEGLVTSQAKSMATFGLLLPDHTEK